MAFRVMGPQRDLLLSSQKVQECFLIITEKENSLDHYHINPSLFLFNSIHL